MTAHLPRLAAGLLLVALLAGGCTIGRSRPTMAPSKQANAAAATTDVNTLRLENERLRSQQAELQARLEEMQKTLAQNQEDQKRFRKSMVTNFDLLEQSVALTLSKVMSAGLDAPAGKPARPHANPTAMSKPKPAPMAVSEPPAMKPRAAKTASEPPVRATPVAAQAGAPAARMSPATMAAAMPGRTAPSVQDPDLLPPEHPTHLTAHREAKPLYEKGFALFARKDYDSAMIVFQNFLKRYPDDIYSDNAQFWIAESLRNMNRNQEAERAYRAVLRNYEHRSTLEGFKTPDAIYRLGQTYLGKADVDRARYYFQVLEERFPETSAGRKASRELSTLGIKTASR